jgi:hypothetical protein
VEEDEKKVEYTEKMRSTVTIPIRVRKVLGSNTEILTSSYYAVIISFKFVPIIIQYATFRRYIVWSEIVTASLRLKHKQYRAGVKYLHDKFWLLFLPR